MYKKKKSYLFSIKRCCSGQWRMGKRFLLRVIVTGLILILFMLFVSVLINVAGIYDPYLNLLVFIVPILIVYIGTGGEESDITGLNVKESSLKECNSKESNPAKINSSESNSAKCNSTQCNSAQSNSTGSKFPENIYHEKNYAALIIASGVPFIIFALLIPLIQIIISKELVYETFYEITAAYFNSVRYHLPAAFGLGIAGIGGFLKTKSIPVSLLCLTASPFISILNTAGTL